MTARKSGNVQTFNLQISAKNKNTLASNGPQESASVNQRNRPKFRWLLRLVTDDVHIMDKNTQPDNQTELAAGNPCFIYVRGLDTYMKKTEILAARVISTVGVCLSFFSSFFFSSLPFPGNKHAGIMPEDLEKQRKRGRVIFIKETRYIYIYFFFNITFSFLNIPTN